MRFYSAAETCVTAVGRPLEYLRSQISPGRALGADERSVNARGETVIEFRLSTARLGDTLLSLSAATAATQWLSIMNPDASVQVDFGHCLHPVVLQTEALLVGEGDPGSSRITLVAGNQETHVPDAIVFDRSALPVWIDDLGRQYPSLPDRYYLALERAAGIRLPSNAPFCPRIRTAMSHNADLISELAQKSTLLTCITATTLSGRKDYGRPRFLEALAMTAREIASLDPLLVVVEGVGEGGDLYERYGGYPVIVLRGWSASDLVSVFSWSAVVLGNDTGLTHLAAMSRDGDLEATVVGLYSRHSHARWRTGLKNHHAVATEFSDWLCATDRSAVRERLDEREAVFADDLLSIPPEWVAANAVQAFRVHHRATG